MSKLTKEQMEEINSLAVLADEAIDTSDIPEQTNWDTMIVGRFYHRASVDVDESILRWFKAKSGDDYQGMINKALFEYMQAHQ